MDTKQKIQIVKWYYSGNSIKKIIELFTREYNDSPHPSTSSVFRLIKKFEATGFLDASHIKKNRPNRAVQQNIKEAVITCAESNARQSLMDISRQHGISKSTVHGILKKAKFYAYKINTCQQLKEVDYENRLQFCKIMMDKIDDDGALLNNILFTDESTFVLTHSPNKQNTRFWSKDNPRESIESHTQYQEKLNVWLGIWGENVIGPIFIDGNLNAEKYLNLLMNDVQSRVQRVAADNGRIVFQQDGAPPHTARFVVEYLHAKYPGRWIGKYGPIEWPPRSPDFAPLDFGIWGHIKNRIYNGMEIESLEDLRDLIIGECERLTPQHLQNVLNSFSKRIEMCYAVGGGHFELYL
ncbi:uncharacterized protein [Prorops nasuta]|uniref:uncharacterized protein n=1 Tax=Prorops nasuta TaxID=863751 RepID=UPI0034CD2DDB